MSYNRHLEDQRRRELQAKTTREYPPAAYWDEKRGYWKRLYEPRRLKYYRDLANRRLRRMRCDGEDEDCYALQHNSYRRYCEVWWQVW